MKRFSLHLGTNALSIDGIEIEGSCCGLFALFKKIHCFLVARRCLLSSQIPATESSPPRLRRISCCHTRAVWVAWIWFWVTVVQVRLQQAAPDKTPPSTVGAVSASSTRLQD